MKTRRLFLTSFVILALARTAWAQAPEMPKAGAEHKRLGYFVGNWTGGGEMKASPLGPAGKITITDSCEWFAGKFAVVCRGQGQGPMGPMKSLGILSYNPEEKAYTYYGIDSSGEAMLTVPRGTQKDGDWVYTDESKMGGKMVKSRYSMKELSPTSYTFKLEMAGEDGSWSTIMEGTETRKTAAK